MISSLIPSPLYLVPLLDGLSWGIMIVLISLGLSLVFGFMEIINFAHGAFYMLGGYVAVSVVAATGSFWPAVLIAPFIVFLAGAAVELVTLRPTYHLGPITQFIVTLGLALGMQGLVILVWGAQSVNIIRPELLSGSVTLLGSQYPIYRLFLIVAGAVLVALIWALLEYSDVGLIIRASLSDKEMARALGNDIPLIYTAVFGAAVASAALAGVLMTPLRGMGPDTGTSIILIAFAVVIIGGLGSMRGSIVAGLGVGVIETFVANVISFRWSPMVIFILLIVVLLSRPRGLFGEKGVME